MVLHNLYLASGIYTVNKKTTGYACNTKKAVPMSSQNSL